MAKVALEEMIMGKIEKNIIREGFTVTYKDGTRESFKNNWLDEKYHGDLGSKIDNHFIDDGFTVYKYDGTKESFKKNWLDDNFTGNKGTHINKNFCNDNYYTYNNNEVNKSNDKIDMSYVEWLHNVVGIVVAIINGIVLKLLGYGTVRIVISCIAICILIAGTMDVVKMIRRKQYASNILVEETIGWIIGVIVCVIVYAIAVF